MSGATVRRGRRSKADELVSAAHRLVLERGENFTTQDLIREADVGLQTLYRNFGGKDRLLVAVMAQLIEAQCQLLRANAASLEDPVARLHSYVTDTLTLLAANPEGRVAAQFLSSQRWRLHQSMPDEVAAATRPYAELLHAELVRATTAGSARSDDPERDALFISRLVLASFHDDLYSGDGGDTASAEAVWRFCAGAVGILRAR